MNLQTPICPTCSMTVDYHVASIDPEAVYLCTRKNCEKTRAKLNTALADIFDDYEDAFDVDKSNVEEAEMEEAKAAAIAVNKAHRGLRVPKGSPLWRKLKREWPQATDEAICDVTIERARKAKPATFTELLYDQRKKQSDEEVSDSDLCFQSAAFDPKLSRPGRPEGADHLRSNGKSMSAVIQDTTGASTSGGEAGVSVIDTGDVSREGTPDWICDRWQFDAFFARRKQMRDQVEDENIVTSWDIGHELDRIILEEFYFNRMADQQIFDAHKSNFEMQRDWSDRVRWTSSGDAVKRRRERLLRERAVLFGAPEEWTPESWRGIIVSYVARRDDGTWDRAIGGFASQKSRKNALKLAEDWGYTGRFPGELADLVDESVFADMGHLEAWMADHGLERRQKSAIL